MAAVHSDDKQADKITLKCTDGKSYEVLRAHALVSGFVDKALQEENKLKTIEVPEKVRALELAGIVKFMAEHKGSEVHVLEKTLDSSTPVLESVVKNKFDRDLVEEYFVKNRLCELFVAADAMGIRSLTDACAARLAVLRLRLAADETILDALSSQTATTTTEDSSSSSSSSSSASSASACAPPPQKRLKK